MTIEKQLEQLAAQRCPREVDVVDRVMAEVGRHPYMQPRHKTSRRLVWTGAFAAAAAVAVLLVNVVVINLHSRNTDGMGSMIAQVNDYSSWCPVEDAALESLDYLYEE
jgi:hypothetical protein